MRRFPPKEEWPAPKLHFPACRGSSCPVRFSQLYTRKSLIKSILFRTFKNLPDWLTDWLALHVPLVPDALQSVAASIRVVQARLPIGQARHWFAGIDPVSGAAALTPILARLAPIIVGVLAFETIPGAAKIRRTSWGWRRDRWLRWVGNGRAHSRCPGGRGGRRSGGDPHSAAAAFALACIRIAPIALRLVRRIAAPRKAPGAASVAIEGSRSRNRRWCCGSGHRGSTGGRGHRGRTGGHRDWWSDGCWRGGRTGARGGDGDLGTVPELLWPAPLSRSVLRVRRGTSRNHGRPVAVRKGWVVIKVIVVAWRAAAVVIM